MLVGYFGLEKASNDYCKFIRRSWKSNVPIRIRAKIGYPAPNISKTGPFLVSNANTALLSIGSLENLSGDRRP
jgi:hypothetical protein